MKAKDVIACSIQNRILMRDKTIAQTREPVENKNTFKQFSIVLQSSSFEWLLKIK